VDNGLIERIKRHISQAMGMPGTVRLECRVDGESYVSVFDVQIGRDYEATKKDSLAAFRGWLTKSGHPIPEWVQDDGSEAE